VGKAIGEILPYALGAAISVVPIIAIILMLVTPKAKTNGTGFAAGFVLGVARRRSNDRASRALDRSGGRDNSSSVLLAGATILGPLVVYLAVGQRATEILGGWRTWLADNNPTVMSVLLLVFSVVLIEQGISGLSG
jgi:hypothetical protein